MSEPSSPSSLPTAQVKPERRFSIVWIVPVLTLVFAALLAYTALRERGRIITVQIEHGHGLKEGDPVRYRGVTIGEVRGIALMDDLSGAVVEVSLRDQEDRIARAGTRFWVVRPRVGLSEIAGLETLVGPRYLAVLPSADAASSGQRHFIALSEAPVVERIDPDDLEIVLEAESRSGLRAGTPITYRGMRIGTVLSIGLASDGSIIEARGHIEQPFRELVRERSRFWNASRVRAEFGLRGFSIEMNSIEELIVGGVALATPPSEEAGDAVRTGHRFALAAQADEDWFAWKPNVVIGSDLLPAGSTLPQPQRATLGWRQGMLIKTARSRTGWILATERGVIGPADLLIPAEKAEDQRAVLETRGEQIELTPSPPHWEHAGLAARDLRFNGPFWPSARMRAANEPEDCIAIADPAGPALPLAPSRLKSEDGRWRIDAALSIDDSWHGACVLARTDGALVGMLLVEDEDDAVVALLPAE